MIMSYETDKDISTIGEKIAEANNYLTISLVFAQHAKQLPDWPEGELSLEGTHGATKMIPVVIREHYTDAYKSELREKIQKAVYGFADAICKQMDLL